MTGRFGDLIRQRVAEELAQAHAAPLTAAQQGLAAVAANDPAAAIPLLTQALGEPGCSAALVTTLADLLLGAGLPAGAVSALRRGCEMVPWEDQVGLLLQLGEALQANEEPVEAEAVYKRILKREQGHHEALLRLGVLSYEAGHYDEAEAWLRQLVIRDRRSPLARRYLALIYMAREDWRAATAQLHWLKQGDATSNEAAMLQATMFERQGDLRSALLELETLAETGKAEEPVYWRIGCLYMGFKQPAEALTAFQGCVARDPDQAEAWLSAGRMLEVLDRMDEALQAYLRVLDLQAGQPEAAMFAGRILEARSNWERAMECYGIAMASPTWREKASVAHDRLAGLLAQMAIALAGATPDSPEAP